MKANRLVAFLLLLAAAFLRLPAQQTDVDRALFNETKAKAEGGDATSQSKLANMYLSGKVVERDFKESAKWALRAAQKGDTVAQETLGFLYDGGYGVEENAQESVTWYRKAAEKGNTQAQCNLANAYERGRGVTRDYREALKYYRLALRDEHTAFFAQTGIGRLYRHGNGVPQDYGEALKFLLPPAQAGWAFSQYELGCMSPMVKEFRKITLRLTNG